MDARYEQSHDTKPPKPPKPLERKRPMFREMLGGAIISTVTGQIVVQVEVQHLTAQEMFRVMVCVVKALNEEFEA